MTVLGLFALLFTPLVYWSNLLFYAENSKLYFFLALTQLCAVAYVWFVYREHRWRPSYNALVLLVLAFIAVLLIASLFGVNPTFSFWGSLDRSGSGLAWLHLAVTFVVLVCVFREAKDWQRVFEVSTIVALIVAVIFFLSLLFPDGSALLSRSKGGSTLGNSSFLGTYLLLQIGMAAYLVLTSIKTRRLLATAATMILVIALVLTTAKAAKLSLLGGGGLFVVLLFVMSHVSVLRHRVGMFFLVTLTALFFVASFLLVQPDSFVHQWFVQESGETRFVLWDIAWQGILERPLLGWGLESYPDVFQTYFNPCLGSQACGGELWFDRAHNTFLDVWIEAGILGLGLYLSLFIVAVLKLWRATKQGTISSAVFALFTSVLVAYVVQGLTVFDTLSSTLSWLVLLGFIATLDAKPVQSSSGGYKGRRLVIALLATILLPFTFYWFVVMPAYGNKATWDVKAATLLSQRLVAYEKAVSVSQQGIDLRRSMLAAQTATFILDLSDEQIAGSPTLLQKELSLAEQGLQQTIDQHPLFLRAYLDLGFLYQAWAARFDESKLSQAEALLKETVARFPNNPLSSWALVGVYLDQGKSAQALELASSALAIDPSVKNSQLRYVLTLKLVGEEEQALLARDAFSQVDPTIGSTIAPYLEKDVSSNQQKMELLFRYYYDAAF